MNRRVRLRGIWSRGFKSIEQPTGTLDEQVAIDVRPRGNRESQQDPSHGCMHTRLKDGTPDANPNESVDCRPAYTHQVRYESQSHSGKSYRETNNVNSVGIEEGDHEYRDNVVHNG